jgi:hypothetical protein
MRSIEKKIRARKEKLHLLNSKLDKYLTEYNFEDSGSVYWFNKLSTVLKKSTKTFEPTMPVISTSRYEMPRRPAYNISRPTITTTSPPPPTASFAVPSYRIPIRPVVTTTATPSLMSKPDRPRTIPTPMPIKLPNRVLPRRTVISTPRSPMTTSVKTTPRSPMVTSVKTSPRSPMIAMKTTVSTPMKTTTSTPMRTPSLANLVSSTPIARSSSSSSSNVKKERFTNQNNNILNYNFSTNMSYIKNFVLNISIINTIGHNIIP